MESIAISSNRKKRMDPRQMARQIELLRKYLMPSLANLRPGDLLPSENELIKRYSFSRAVIRNLYRQLQQEGAIKSHQNKGFYLTDKVAEEDPNMRKYDLTIAIVAFIQHEHPDSQYSGAAMILSSFEAKAAKYRSRSKLYNLWPENDISIDMLEQIKADNPDGILFQYNYDFCTEEHIRKLQLLNIPLVVSGYESENVNCIVFDHEQIALTAAEHLLERGHRRLAFIQRSDCEYVWMRERLSGIEKAVLRSGGDCRYFNIEVPPVEGISLLNELRDNVVPVLLRDEITGVVCSGEIYAVLLMDILKELNVKVPGDIAIVGIDDHWSFRKYDLTTVQVAQGRLGVAAFDLLADLIKPNSDVPIMYRVHQCPLIIRSTT